MYKIKQKRTGFFFKFTLLFLALAAIGLGVGYASAKLMEKTSEIENIQSITSAAPPDSNLPQSKAASGQTINEPAPSSAAEDEYIYLIKYEDGETKVFDISGGKKTLTRTLPIEPASLRQEDLTMLRDGVLLKSKNELLSFIEDFCS